MAAADWAECAGVLDISTVDRGVTSGIARPSGGGSFLYGFNSRVNTVGAVALHCSLTNFSPTNAMKGGSIRGAVQRGPSGGVAGFSPFLFIGLDAADVNGNGYILGLQDDDPHRIVLRKGTILNGVPGGTPGTLGILGRSTATYGPGTWLHLRLDMIVNANGDVLLKAYANNLAANAVTTPVWASIAGATSIGGTTLDFIDDALGVNTGTPPYTSGRMGFGFACSEVSRRGYFDQIECLRQN